MPGDLMEARAALLRRLVEAGGAGMQVSHPPSVVTLWGVCWEGHANVYEPMFGPNAYLTITPAGRAALRAHDAAQAERVRP